MKNLLLVLALGLAAGAMGPAAASDSSAVRSPSPAVAETYFISPQDGATTTSPVTVVMGLKGMGVAPAGMTRPDTGHFHLLVDTDLPPMDRPIPNDDHHRHFGGGQTETTLTLSPGRHTLQILMGDALHIPHEPPVMSKQITIAVE